VGHYALSFSKEEEEDGISSIVLTGPVNHFLADNTQLKDAKINTPKMITTE
jgi:hypothetical protein